MNTDIEEWGITLRGSFPYSGTYGERKRIDIGPKELLEAPIGAHWSTWNTPLRAGFFEEARLIYRNHEGCALHWRYFSFYDNPEEELREFEEEILWIYL